MKRIANFSLSCVMVLALAVVPASAITIDLSSLPGGGIQFSGAGSSFDLLGSPFFPNPVFPLGAQMWVAGGSGGFTGSSIAYQASVLGGPFTYGPISVSGVDERALVTGPLGTFTLWDGAFALTGTVNWLEVSTHGSVGSLNAHHIINVTGITYAGADPDLLQLAATSTAMLNLSFQYGHDMTLTQLTTGSGPYVTSFSATISTEMVPDGGTTLALLGLGLAGLGVWRRR